MFRWLVVECVVVMMCCASCSQETKKVEPAPVQATRKARKELSFGAKRAALAARNPVEDARAFFKEGGTGFVMGYGGVLTPMGTSDPFGLSDSRYSRSFSRLETSKPDLFHEISPLLSFPTDSFPIHEIFKNYKGSKSAKWRYFRMRNWYGKTFGMEMERLMKSKG